MTEREKLVNLLFEWGNKENDGVRAESIADYLLENGVIVPPCKVGDMVYEICLGKLSGQKTIKQSKVTAIKITDKLTITLDYTTNFYDTDIGRWLFVGNNAEEEAEKALKDGVKE